MNYNKKEIAELAVGSVAIAGSALASGELGEFMYEVFVGPAGQSVYYASVAAGGIISTLLVYDAIWRSWHGKQK